MNPINAPMPMLTVLYVALLGLLCACFVEIAIYALFPGPKYDGTMRGYQPEASEAERVVAQRKQDSYQAQAERHSAIHYMFSLLGSTAQACIALLFHVALGVLADGILLGAVFTLGVGTVIGVSGGGRLSKLAVATVSLVVALGLGWLKFLPHGG